MAPQFSSEPEQLSQLDKTTREVAKAVSQFKDLISHAVKPLPTGTGDGTDLDPNDYHTDAAEAAEGVVSDLSHLGITDYETLFDVLKDQITGEMINDKTYFMEGLIRTAAKLPDSSKMGTKLTEGFLTQLWNDLEHPPQSYLGQDFKYRQPDGSYNSLKHPKLGAAGMSYARTVQPKTPQPVALPDAGVVFDSIMSRKVSEEHPNKISSVLFYLASIIIHDLFRTDHQDFSKSNTSSYLDLSPLYGSNWDEQKTMRTFKDGKLKPDCFAEKRLLMFPPGVGVLLIMFNRFHNYVVEQLALINEGGRFNKPVEGRTGPHAQTWEKYDDDLFQTARLITCGLYINIILLDYVRTILNLQKTNSNWALNPRMDIKGVETATGNQVSAEFNLVYRWHSAISEKDEKWTEDLWKEMFPDLDPKKVGMHEFLQRLSKLEKMTPEDPLKRKFHHLERKKDGTLDDDALVKIITESIEDCANSFGAQRVPAVMRAIEVLGIQQARAWNVATLNEFRKYFNLTPHRTFEDINSDPHVADQLRRLYDHPDHVEMYPGLVAEEAKLPMTPGAGLTPSYTVSRAVLSDAVALVRGDRFYTTDYHPKQLTNWGYALVESDKTIDHGAVFFKLFMRAFPNHFEPNSVYAHYPMTVPSEMERCLKDLGTASKYSFKKPALIGMPQLVFTYKTAEQVLSDKETFHVTWGPAMEFLMGKPAKNFMLAGDGYENAESRRMMSSALYVSDWMKEVKAYYLQKSSEILKEKSYKLGDLNQVDIIRDVGNLVHVHFAADLFSLPLKTKQHPHGIFTEHELYLVLAGVFTVVFFDLDPGSSFPLREKAHDATQKLGQLAQLKVQEIKSGGGILSAAMALLFPPAKTNPLHSYGTHLIQRLLAANPDMSVHDLVWGHIMGTAGGMAPNQGQLFAQTLEFFLHTPEGRRHLPTMRQLAAAPDDDDDAFDTLMHYLLEGSRLGGETGVFRYATRDVQLVDGSRTLSLKKGDRLMVHLRAVSRDASVFPDPDAVRLDRPLESYIHLGAGPHRCLGLPMTRVALTALLKTVLRECGNGLRPAAGLQGVVRKVEQVLDPTGKLERPEVRYHKYLTEMNDSFFPFPTAMKINWDDLDAAPALNGNGIMHTNGSSNSNDQYEASSSGQPISARDPLNG
ncbi:heme peroxidase [Phyllosticta capitalensis]|uniref:heme peroxidase n=1 Tax=Phyllosticta capitalensis TaxID=121624 RepID=UPI00312D2C15